MYSGVAELQMAAREEREATMEALRRRRAQILSDTAAGLSGAADPDCEVMPKLYRSLCGERIIDAMLGFIVADDQTRMRLGFMQGFDAAMVQRCLTLDFGQAICGTVALTRSAMHVTDIQRSLDPVSKLLRSAGITAYACEPLLVGDRLLGTLSFASRSRRSFSAEDLILFRSIAGHVAKARDRSARRALLRRCA